MLTAARFKDTSPFPRRAAEGILFIGLWMILGRLFRLDANQYLLAGVPLTLLFQLFVRRQPLRALWVRDQSDFAIDKAGWIMAITLGIFPIKTTIHAFFRGNYSVALWGMCALCGAVAAAYALRKFRRDTVRHLLICTAIAGPIGIAVMTGAALMRHGATSVPLILRIQTFGKSMLLYFPVSFILEEVAFRGALDSHLHSPEESRSWMSAFIVSALWGVWHLPIVPGGRLLTNTVSLLIVHCAIGIPLSIYWRKSGNLAVPALSHALIDAVRNALL